jgi:hypothetical protein
MFIFILNEEGVKFYMRLLIPSSEPIKLKQPDKCQQCIWGHWDGLKQFCPKVVCIKE